MERTDDKACADHPAQSSRKLITEKGINVFVILCFKDHTADNGNTGLIPVRYDETGKFWMMVSPYSQEGRDHRFRVAKEFTLPKVDEEWADSRWWVDLKDSIKVGLGFLAGGWALLWTLTWAIGWIVRGFLGIPMGQDRGVEKG